MLKRKRLENKKRKLEAYLNLIKEKDDNYNKKISNKKKSQPKDIVVNENEEVNYKHIKKEIRMIRNPYEFPKLTLQVVGYKASLGDSLQSEMPIYFADILRLIQLCYESSQSISYSNYNCPTFCYLRNRYKVSHTVLVIIEGVCRQDIISYANCPNTKYIKPSSKDAINKSDFKPPDILQKLLPSSASLFHVHLEVVSPYSYGGSVLQEITLLNKMALSFLGTHYHNTLSNECLHKSLHMNLKKMFTIRDERGKELSSKISNIFGKLQLLLTFEELIEHRFPLNFMEPSLCRFTYSKEFYTEVCEKSPLFAVDCEMCLTSVGELELTNVSVVNEKLEVIYSSLVKPHNPIVNYLTQFSGITEDKLNGVTTRLEDVQQHLKEILPSDAILVGHSLNSDLEALKLMHPYVIDTSLIYNLHGIRNRRSSLKSLCVVFLHKIIQDDSLLGHDPSEDAMVAMQLVLLKLEKGLTFGNEYLQLKMERKKENCEMESVKEEEEKKLRNGHENIFDLVYSKHKKYCIVARKKHELKWKRLFKEKNEEQACPSIELLDDNRGISERAAQVAIHNDLTYVHYKITASKSNESFCSKMQQLDQWLGYLHENCATKALIIANFVPSKKQYNQNLTMHHKGSLSNSHLLKSKCKNIADCSTSNGYDNELDLYKGNFVTNKERNYAKHHTIGSDESNGIALITVKGQKPQLYRKT